MRRKRAWLWLLALILAAGAVSTLTLTDPPLHAQSVNKLQRQQQQIQKQLRDTRSRINILRQHEDAARQRKGALDGNIEITSTRIEDTQFRLDQARQAVQKAQQQLEVLEAKLKLQQTGTSARLRYLQRQGAEQWWALLLSSQDLNQFFDRRHQLQLLIESDRKLIAELQKTAKQVLKQRLALENQKNDLALVSEQLAGQKQELQAQAAIQQQLIGRLSSQRSAYEAAQQRLQADSQQVSALIQRLIAAQRQKKGGDPVQGTGRLRVPVGGPVTSGFGWRVHPIYRTSRFHSGIDFGVSSGTPVGAADRGTVLYAGWYGGYGLAVIINHGGGITTLYAHNSNVYVSPGQVVQRGQAIAASGSTGLSTGPHVHFEVRVNGQPVDPRRYL